MPNFPTQSQLSLPLLNVIDEAGGRLTTREACDLLADKAGVSVDDRNAIGTHATGSFVLWDRHVRWVKEAVDARDLLKSSARGVWELTESGSDLLQNAKPGVVLTVYETDNGIALWAEAEAAASVIRDNSVKLVVTSPPYPLIRKKDYANQLASREHVQWLARFFDTVGRKLTTDGSLWINLAHTWEAGQPTLDLWCERLLLELRDSVGYHLCQKLYWHNQSKLPAPAEWVTVRRVRVNPAVEEIFWLSKTPHPFADNKQALRPYSEAMKQRLSKGGEKAVVRPSGHELADGAFGADNGGSIAHSLLEAANTSSNGDYHRYCRENGLPLHPARFPSALPEFAIKLCTRPGDLVWDPFGGSATTAEAAERLGRAWVTNDKSLGYLLGSAGRFPQRRMQALPCLNNSETSQLCL